MSKILVTLFYNKKILMLFSLGFLSFVWKTIFSDELGEPAISYDGLTNWVLGVKIKMYETKVMDTIYSFMLPLSVYLYNIL